MAFNTGSGFAPAVEWRGALPEKHLNDTANYNLGGGVYWSHAFYIPFTVLFVVVNPGGDYSESAGRREAALMDIDGDGLADHVRSDSDSRIEAALNRTGLTNKLKGVVRPLGASFTLGYQRDGNTYDLPQRKWVLSRVEINDGHEGDGVDKQVVTYRYSGGKQDRYERDFYGYRAVVAEYRDAADHEAVKKTVTRTYRNDSYYTKGLLESEEVRDGGGRLFTKTVNQYRLWDVTTRSEFIDIDPNRAVATVFPQLVRTEKYFYEGQTSGALYTYVTYDYDQYGNVTRYFDAGDAGAGDDVTLVITYYEDLQRYIVEKPASVKVYGNDRLMRHREGTYDAAGNLTELCQYLEDGQAAVTNLAYYSNGNLKQVTGPPNLNGQRYSVAFEYDPVVSTYITRITDSFRYTSTAQYNYLYGQESQSVDINGHTMRWEYDAFGRPTQIFGPYDEAIPAVEFKYYSEETPARAVTHNKVSFEPDNEETLDTVIFIDGLTRVIQTKKEGEVLLAGAATGVATPAYGMNVTGRIRFDALNRVAQQGQPVFQAGYDTGFYAGVPLKNPTTNQYDVLDRKTLVTLPDGSTIKTAYTIENGRFKTTVTDPEGKVKHSYQDVGGQTVKTEQFNQGQTITTAYEYDPLKEIVRIVDDRGNATRMAYDFLGRRTSIENPDRGLVEFFYDLAGNLVRKVDGNLRNQGQAITYVYEYNRLQKIDYPVSADVEYFYGGPGENFNRAGRVTKIADASGTTEFFYGKLGEEVKQVRTITALVPDSQITSFTTETGYDYLGRVTWLKYPDGEKADLRLRPGRAD
ncbi:MAG: toxin TcdB middle/N-terminal domain-containing protein [Syntrophothermus sp.]